MDQHPSRFNSSEYELLLDAVFRSAIDGIIVINAEGTIEMVNQAAANLFKYTSENMVGKNVSLIVPSPHKGQHDHYIKRYLQTGEAKIIGIGREVDGLRKDGTTFPLRLSISELHINGGRKFTGIVHDLSEQKKAQEALQKEKERAQTYFDLANTMNLVLDPNGRIVQINKRAQQFLGRSEAELVGQDWMDTFIPAPLTKPDIDFPAMSDQSKPFVPFFESKTYDHHQNTYFFAWHTNFLYNDAGHVAGYILSGTDITKRRLMELELEERVNQRTEELASAVNKLLSSNQKLEFEIRERKAAVDALRKKEMELRQAYEKEMELSRLKSRFVSMASHEFRTPLATIQSSSDLIEAYVQTDQHPQRLKHSRRIRSAVTHLNNILNDFLSLSRLEEGRIQMEPVRFTLTGFCKELMEELDGILKPGQSIIHPTPIPDETITLDKKLLKNILINLLSNAIKYSPEQADISCQITLQNEEIYLAVEDQGIGIPKADQPHLFGRFFRAQNVENIKGTGLGLHIVKQYVSLMGGKIDFRSEEGVGTLFMIYLPLEPDPSESAGN